MRHEDDRQRVAAREAQDRRAPGDARGAGVEAPRAPEGRYDRVLPPVRVTRPLAARVARLAFVVLAAVALTACGDSPADETATPPATGKQETAVALVSPRDAQAAIDAGGVVVLDVRTPDEFAAGHIAGAENIDFYREDFGGRIDDLDHSARYVVYCHTGNRSGQATAMMVKRGFTDVSDVDGGIAAWEAAGMRTVTG